VNFVFPQRTKKTIQFIIDFDEFLANEIRRAGLDIVEMLKVNTTLTFVDLTGNVCVRKNE